VVHPVRGIYPPLPGFTDAAKVNGKYPMNWLKVKLMKKAPH
jgi:hypothetical protein